MPNKDSVQFDLTPGMPSKGWYFQIGSSVKECKVYHNGELVPGITSVSITADAKTSIVSAKIEIIDVKTSGELPEQNVRRKALQLSLFNTPTLAKWISEKATTDHPDYDILMFFAKHADEVKIEDISGYEWIVFHMPDKSTVRWSTDEGWDNPIEDAIRALWACMY